MQVLKALGYITRMEKGESQPHIIQAADDAGQQKTVVVKFQGNPQGTSILAHDLVGTLLAQKMGLTTLTPGLITVDADFLRDNQECKLRDGTSYTPGSQFCTELLRRTDQVARATQLTSVRNPSELYGLVVFDTWLVNGDRRNSLDNLLIDKDTKCLCLVDQGYCFGGSSTKRRNWITELANVGAPMQFHGKLYDQFVRRLTDPGQFAHYISACRRISDQDLKASVDCIPAEWLVGDIDRLRMVQFLKMRRNRLEYLLQSLMAKGATR